MAYEVIDVWDMNNVVFTGTETECKVFIKELVSSAGYIIINHESELNKLINDNNTKKL